MQIHRSSDTINEMENFGGRLCLVRNDTLWIFFVRVFAHNFKILSAQIHSFDEQKFDLLLAATIEIYVYKEFIHDPLIV